MSHYIRKTDRIMRPYKGWAGRYLSIEPTTCALAERFAAASALSPETPITLSQAEAFVVLRALRAARRQRPKKTTL